jgi:hypothetical protein
VGPRSAALLALPAVAIGVAASFLPEHPARSFQADVAVLAVTAGAWGMIPATARATALLVLPSALLPSLVHGAAFGLWEGAARLGALLVAAALAASGLAAVGRRVGAPGVAAGAVAACVLWTAMAGLWWADRVAEGLPPVERHGFRQAVLHVDLATAAAYDAADYDRFHDPDVYARVPLASALMERPRALTTAAVWGVAGALAWAVALLLRPGSGRRQA